MSLNNNDDLAGQLQQRAAKLADLSTKAVQGQFQKANELQKKIQSLEQQLSNATKTIHNIKNRGNTELLQQQKALQHKIQNLQQQLQESQNKVSNGGRKNQEIDKLMSHILTLEQRIKEKPSESLNTEIYRKKVMMYRDSTQRLITMIDQTIKAILNAKPAPPLIPPRRLNRFGKSKNHTKSK